MADSRNPQPTIKAYDVDGVKVAAVFQTSPEAATTEALHRYARQMGWVAVSYAAEDVPRLAEDWSAGRVQLLICWRSDDLSRHQSLVEVATRGGRWLPLAESCAALPE